MRQRAAWWRTCGCIAPPDAESRLEYCSLYTGVKSRELESASPQLVELLPGHRLTLQVFGAIHSLLCESEAGKLLDFHRRNGLLRRSERSPDERAGA
jgi:hypothetical protein